MNLRHGSLLATIAASLVASAAVGGDEVQVRRVPRWGEVVDPSRDCKVSLDPTRDRLTIAVPGTPHVLSAEVAGLPLSAPRVLQEVSGAFKASVRVAGNLEPRPTKTTEYDPYHGAGLIVWKDERNYLRLERAVAIIKGHRVPYLNYELRDEGRLIHSQGIPIKDHPLHLKLERSGKEIRAWHGPDGSHWSELPSLTFPRAGPIKVGVVAVNSSGYPMMAELEQWLIATSPATEVENPAAIEGRSKPAGAAGDREKAK